MRTGTLAIVGTGIKAAAHATLEAQRHIEQAESVLYLVADLAVRRWILQLNKAAVSLHTAFGMGKSRYDCYEAVVERILQEVRAGKRVCAAFYGHPGVAVYPSHEAVRRARCEGYRATLLPGISAEDCLFADLGVDPGHLGCQTFEATEFLVYNHRANPEIGLVLWQIGVVGELRHIQPDSVCSEGIGVLQQVLLATYSPDHVVVIYEAAQFPIVPPRVTKVQLAHLSESRVSAFSTLYVPPVRSREPDRHMLQRLKMQMPRPRPANIKLEMIPNGTGAKRG